MKKKLFFFASLLTAAAATLGLASCSNEMTPDQPMREGMVDVVMTTSLPQALQSYGVNSADGGLKNLEGKNLTVRYIMEIYPKGSETLVERQITYKSLNADGDYRTASFSTRLLATEYNFVFWADIVSEASSVPYNQQLEGLNASKFYANAYFFSNTDTSSDVLWRPTDVNLSTKGDLRTIRASKTGDAIKIISPEMYDGYSCTELVDLRTEPTTQTFTLKRPFAKLRIITTDADKLQAKPDWSKTGAIISDAANVPNLFNALTGKSESGERTDAGYWKIFMSTADTYTSEDESTTDRTLGVFYLPAPSSAQNLAFKFRVIDEAGNELADNVTLAVENVPLVGNKLTTIKGNLLSKNATVNIIIDDVFEDDETIIEYGKEASTVDALKASMTGKDETITYTGKVTKAEGFELDFTNVAHTNPVYAEGNTTTLTLAFASIEDGAVLTFKGDNAPKTLCIKTDTKCSLRINLPKTDINYDGSVYKYIVSNAGCKTKRDGAIYEAMFRAGNGSGFYSYTDTDYDESHLFKINADFTLPANIECLNDIMHESGSCSWASTLTAGTNIWDFVGNSNN